MPRSDLQKEQKFRRTTPMFVNVKINQVQPEKNTTSKTWPLVPVIPCSNELYQTYGAMLHIL